MFQIIMDCFGVGASGVMFLLTKELGWLASAAWAANAMIGDIEQYLARRPE